MLVLFVLILFNLLPELEECDEQVEEAEGEIEEENEVNNWLGLVLVKVLPLLFDDGDVAYRVIGVAFEEEEFETPFLRIYFVSF